METEFAKRLPKCLKAIEAMFAVVSYGFVAFLGILYYLGILAELWVVLLPAVQHLALQLVVGGYVGAKVAPGVIEDRERNST
ncbi:MAG: hypothetical protein KUG77_27970 [Nannocystaceae bacterium]|nr:hypothetical protein [Nannocystaceae bacterium]